MDDVIIGDGVLTPEEVFAQILAAEKAMADMQFAMTRSVTAKLDDIFGGAYAGVWVKITDMGRGIVKIDIWGDGKADIRGLFIDWTDSAENAALKGLVIKGVDVTGTTTGNDSVKFVSGDSSVNLNGEVLKAAGA